MVQLQERFKYVSRVVSSDILSLLFPLGTAFQGLNFTGHQCKRQSVGSSFCLNCLQVP